jgi:LacI family transcriptional regulator
MFDRWSDLILKISIKKLSEITGFSPATISNALNNKKGVNKETADQILKIAKELGYQSETKVTHIKIVTFIKHSRVGRESDPYTSLVEWMEKECRSAGYKTIIYNLEQTDPKFKDCLDELLNDRSSGILLLAAGMQQEDAELFKDSLAPVVVIDNWFDDVLYDSILISNTDSVHNAVNYLIRKGHREIGYIRSSLRIRNFYYRELGYYRALRENNIDLVPEYIFDLEMSTDGAYRGMKDYLSRPHKLPTALIADDDLFAFSAIKALKEYGYKIPEDVSIIGFDDLPFCNVSSPPLTSIKVNKQGMAQMAVRRLIDQIKGAYSANMKIQICTEFIERESVMTIPPQL